MNTFSPLTSIQVYDDVLLLPEQQNLVNYCMNSNYSIVGWTDLIHSREGYTHSLWSPKDLKASRFLVSNNVTKILNSNGLTMDRFSKCVINIDTLSDSHWPHVHDETVLLFYLNMEWAEGWGGETLFYDGVGKEIVYGSKFTPNRVIVFDGKIPHNIKHQNRVADKYRMSMSIFFHKKEVL
jgi:hypothetical protein